MCRHVSTSVDILLACGATVSVFGATLSVFGATGATLSVFGATAAAAAALLLIPACVRLRVFFSTQLLSSTQILCSKLPTSCIYCTVVLECDVVSAPLSEIVSYTPPDV